MGLFDKQVARKPNNYPETQKFIDAIDDGFWTVRKFNFRTDYSQFQELDPEVKGILIRAVSAIAQIEVAVKLFWSKLGDKLPQPPLVDLGVTMANNERIHNSAYEKLLEVLNLNDIFEKNLEKGVLADRVKYLQKYNEKNYNNEEKQFIYSIILFTLFVENVSLFSQFLTILHFHRFHNILPHTAQQISYTKNEENLHAEIGIWLINKLRQEYPKYFDKELEAKITEEIGEAFKAESKVIDWIVEGYEEEGFSASILKAFIKKRINESMVQIGYGELPISEEELQLAEKVRWFESEIKGVTTTDFFHKHPVEYSKASKTYDLQGLF